MNDTLHDRTDATDDYLHRALLDLADDAPHDPQLAATIRRRSGWRRMTTAAPVAAALAVLLVVAGMLLFRPARPAPTHPASACQPVQTSVLPSWARVGFTDPEPEMPSVLSDHGLFLAIVFVPALVSPPAADYNNKILWAARPADPRQTSMSAGDRVDLSFHIDGRLEGTSTTMSTTVPGGPGPSIVDVPAPGCWVLRLTWGRYTDTVALPYADRASAGSTTG
ncbi:hypothetical protein [Nakamurella endophytica]|uniref:Uncharacterized protein n=1 Tax=Nakamurella endophytica TaxID=1748367 RepID=A0A917WE90_9ACTN|nr:hypothetical protein [Nakamurella endophytica]GGL97446.1 hypothetical protein GCM10011594_16550 [Nakamurella endophytica]